MPITKSAKKALRSSSAKRQRNNLLKNKMKNALKKCSEKTIPQAFSLIDKVAKQNLIHKNKASRMKSKLSKKFTDISEKKPVSAKKSAPKSKKKKK